MSAEPGKLVIISGPSGVGKSTIVPLVRQRFGEERLRMSISATTRDPRPGEIDGENYHFLADDEFQRRLAAGEFLEAIEVFGRGHWYGTLLAEVLPSLEQGVWVILEIDVDGAARAVEKFPEAITLFISPAADPEASICELRRRLEVRGTESKEAIDHRLEVASKELAKADQYKHIVVNDNIKNAVDAIASLLSEAGLQQQDQENPKL